MKKTKLVADLLRSVPGLATLPDASLAELVDLVDEVLLQPDEVLAREGTSGRQAFVVLNGRGKVFVDGEQIATVRPGEFIGEMAMLDNQPRSATVRAESVMRLLEIGPQAFASFVEHPGVLKAMASQLSERLRRADAANAAR